MFCHRADVLFPSLLSSSGSMLKFDTTKNVIEMIVLIFNCNGEAIHCSRCISASVYLSSKSSVCKRCPDIFSFLSFEDGNDLNNKKKVIRHLPEQTKRLLSVVGKNCFSSLDDIHRSDILSGYYTLRLSLSLSLALSSSPPRIRKSSQSRVHGFISMFRIRVYILPAKKHGEVVG